MNFKIPFSGRAQKYTDKELEVPIFVTAGVIVAVEVLVTSLFVSFTANDITPLSVVSARLAVAF